MTFLEDAINDVFDRAILISADGDHVPPVRRIRIRCPEKQIFLAVPPKRFSRANELRKVCTSAIEYHPAGSKKVYCLQKYSIPAEK
jgi:hypothetical protein